MSAPRFPWDVLGIAPTDDRKAVRSAYAERLKAIDPDQDIAGYSRLRDARDEALWLIREGQATGAHAAPSESDLNDWFAGGGDAPGAGEAQPDAAAEPVPPPDNKPADDKPGRFIELLFPGHEFTPEPLTREEYEAGADLMRGIMADAQAATVDRQGGIEDWLAHYLASSWPRSGPLVEDAVAAFGWDRDTGRIDEHAAVAFLNARLNALAFLRQLDQPDHEWHAAYVELRKPGPRSRLPWKGADIRRITDLLVFIRENYPELEEYLDGPRVASYTQPDEVENPWKWVGITVVVLIFVARFMASMASDTPPGSTPPLPDYYAAAQPVWTTEQKQDLLDELFGPGVDYGALAHDAPDLYASIGRLGAIDITQDQFRDDAYGMAHNSLRLAILRAAAHAPFEELVAIRQYELDLLRWVRAQGNSQDCRDIGRWLSYPQEIDRDADFTAQERVLARRLLDAGLLEPDETPSPTQASIPGEVVQAMMNALGVDRARFDVIAAGNGSVSDSCNFRIALLEEMLRRPGNMPPELLRLR